MPYRLPVRGPVRKSRQGMDVSMWPGSVGRQKAVEKARRREKRSGFESVGVCIL